MSHFARHFKRHLRDCFFQAFQPEHHGPCGRDEWGGTAMHGHRGDDPLEGQTGFGSGWGVRRPLRFLAHKLDLDDKQVAELARIFDELKIERAQAEVDNRRALVELADAIQGATFDAGKVAAAGERRVQSATKLRDALTQALAAIHTMLNPEQRERFAYLIRSGVLAF